MAGDFRSNIDRVVDQYNAMSDERNSGLREEEARRAAIAVKFLSNRQDVIRPIMETAKSSLEAKGHQAQIVTEADLSTSQGAAFSPFIELKIAPKSVVIDRNIILPSIKYSLDGQGVRLVVESKTRTGSGSSTHAPGEMTSLTKAGVEHEMLTFVRTALGIPDPDAPPA